VVGVSLAKNAKPDDVDSIPGRTVRFAYAFGCELVLPDVISFPVRHYVSSGKCPCSCLHHIYNKLQSQPRLSAAVN